MTDPDAIPGLGEVTAAWLSDRLRAAGHADAEISDCGCVPIGTGQFSTSVRFALRYARPRPEYPTTIVGKFPSTDPRVANAAVRVHAYAREVGFYRHLRSRLTIPTPACLHAAISGDGPEFVLLLEDMQPAQQGDQLAGCDPGLARAAVVQLVGLHGPTWCDDSLKEAAWLSLGDPAEVNVMLGMFYRGVLGDFVDRNRDGLSPQETALLEHVGNATTLPFSPPPTETFCIVHQDYRLDNLLIDDRRTPPAITAVDWQSPAVGGPLTDVAYFLGASLRPEDRRAAEVDIVRAYHDALRAFGITDFGWSECWEEYRRASLHGLVVAVLAAMGAERTERGDELIAAMVHRHSAHAFDAAAVEFLD